MQKSSPRALMILGPTASGKTAVSLALSRVLDMEIISVDSALVYRGMDIGTAKPDAAERALVPHHLIDIVDIEQSYSAADFRADAARLIDEIASRGKLPVIVGGTMLYAKALREGIDELPSTTPEVRQEVARRGALWGGLRCTKSSRALMLTLRHDSIPTTVSAFRARWRSTP